MSYFCYQGNNNDCGFAALKMMLAKYSNNKSYLYIKKPKKKELYSFLDLINIGKEYGFTIEGFVSEKKDIKDLKEGCICVVNSNHCIVVEKITKNTIVLLDPGEGKIKKKHKDFLEIWNGKILEIIGSKSDQKFSLKKNEILPIKYTFYRIGISLGFLATLLIGFLFIDKSEYFILSIVLLSLIPLIEIFENIITLKIINYFDSKYIPLYFDNVNLNKKETYCLYQDFKKKYLLIFKAISSAVILIIFLIFMMAINDLRNLLISAIILLSIFVEKVLFLNSDKQAKKDISVKENLALESKDQIDCKLLLECNRDANKFVRKKSYRKCFQILLCLFLTFVIMFMENTITANFLIFHFGIYYILCSNFDQVLDGLFNLPDLKKIEVQFRDKCNI